MHLYNKVARKRDPVPPLQEIVPGLYLARRLQPGDIEELEKHNISSILDATAEFDALQWTATSADMSYLNIPILDHQYPREDEVLKAINWIHGQRASNKNVVVHCALGRGRSVFLVAAYLLTQNRDKTVREVLTDINVIRQTAGLNMSQLRALEKIHQSEKITLYPNAWIVANPVSGGGKWPQYRKQICDLLGQYYALTVVETTEDCDGKELAQKAVKANADMVIAAGGDGTVNEVADVLKGTAMPMGLIPLGTTNALSHALWGFKAKAFPIETACDALIQRKIEKFDIGLCNEELFTLVLGIGFESRMIELADRNNKNESGQLAYLNGLFQAINEDQQHHLEIKFNDEDWLTLSTKSLVIANSAPLFTLLAQGGGRPDAKDGKLDITWLDETYQQGTVSGMLQLLLSEVNEPQNPTFKHRQAEQVTLKADEQITYSLDGEMRKAKSLSISVLPEALQIITLPEN
ncbi:diacylglycerol kinase catalytic subunit [Planctobacterium marinum]|uniref:Diacylglycerol kinase catalytic subunit n=1 Tax=Planctobacterium marinum TaxID=1631968 RepID=A0AA48KR16_9ALTE|nr:diacylglycerol kinase catalytic subunit [Planctobacterium marinum]